MTASGGSTNADAAQDRHDHERFGRLDPERFACESLGNLIWNPAGVASSFPQVIAQPVWSMAGNTLDVFAEIEGILSIFGTISDKVTDAYGKNLFDGARLQQDVAPFDNGKTPRFLFSQPVCKQDRVFSNSDSHSIGD